uniref:Uncharacterized protein ycf19 n=1 Tax=Anthurium amnicola TaxID=1678845 RepID=A0A1D1Y6Z5_9ARAE
MAGTAALGAAAVVGMAASAAGVVVVVARPVLLLPGLSATAARSRRYPRLPPASFSPRLTHVTKATPTTAAAAAFAAAARPSFPELATAAGRALLGWAKAAAGRAGADLGAPWAAAVGGAGRCLDLYREILLVRCLLTWFPNVPWERQPFSAMRDLCDPFLLVCQRLVPPVFGGTLDVSSLLAFTALGILARLLTPTAAASPPPF